MIVGDLLEKLRLQEFAAYVGPDNGPDPRFLRLTRLARRKFGIPMAMVNLIDATDMWPKAADGINAVRMPRETSLCNLVVQDGTLVMGDLSADPRFAALPAVAAADGLRFYAGAPIRTPAGQTLGVFCVLDRRPRLDFGPEQVETLETLAGIAMDQLALDRALRDAAAAREAAERMAGARASFLAVMSHEIRTPLNSIVGFGELLDRAGLPEPLGDYARTVHEMGRDLLHLLNHTLDYAKLESGTVELEDRPFRPAEVAQRSQRLVEKVCQDKGLSLELTIDPRLPDRLRGDGLRLQQILGNLLFNAAKFTDKGGITVTLRLDAQDDRRSWLRADVVDTGIGVAPERRDRLFQAFYQADASHSRRFGGSGLGLAICRQLAQAMGGTIGYEPAEGDGSRFWLRLPFVPA
ncbi:GAF domain-containing sensor histidine kinase [Niveispirillum fermenti]|uniref:GAF domain-containing sensor histidine kinase n=1 Tax=Niveispirillum fermenti TaxID=1233113 RepID=UPI003A8A5A91